MKPASEIPIPESALQGITWPAVPNIKSSVLLTLLFQLEQSQWWPLERLRDAQFRQAEMLLRHAFETTAYYSEHLGAADYRPDTPLDEESWRNLPLLKREDIQQAGRKLYSRALPTGHGATEAIVISEPTGKPVELLGTSLTNTFWNAFTVRDFLWRRCDLSGKLAAIRYDRTGAAPYPDGAEIPNWGKGFASAGPTGPSSFLSIQTPVRNRPSGWRARTRIT